MAQPGLRSNPKFRRLLKRLKLPAPYVIGLLECMWHVGYATGNALLGDAEDVELAAEWPGRRGVFFNAIKKDWLDEHEGQYSIHDLWENAPEYVRKRIKRRRSSEKSGDREESQSDQPSNDNDLGEETDATRRPDHEASAPSSLPTLPYPSLPSLPCHGAAEPEEGGPKKGRNGVGSKREGGNGHAPPAGNLCRDLTNLGEMAQLQALLARIGVYGANQNKLLGRKDITLAWAVEQVSDIQRDPSADLAAVFMHRANQRRAK